MDRSEGSRVVDLNNEPVPGPPAHGAHDARGHGPNGRAEGDRQIDAVVVPGPTGDRMPSPSERRADRASGGRRDQRHRVPRDLLDRRGHSAWDGEMLRASRDLLGRLDLSPAQSRRDGRELAEGLAVR